MTDFTENDITRYVLGDLNPSQMGDFEKHMKENEDFAKSVELEKFVLGTFFTRNVDSRNPAGVLGYAISKIRPMRAFATLLIGLVLMTATGYAISVINDNTIMRDNLRSKSFDLQKWETQPEEFPKLTQGLVAREGFVQLVNRGYLEPKRDFPDAFSIEFEWQWEMIGLDPGYSDCLTVAIRTNGEPNQAEFDEVSDGVIIKFDATANAISIGDANQNIYGWTGKSSIKMPYDEWHKIKIVDDGNQISVFIEGPEITRKQSRSPILTRNVPRNENGGHRVVIYNREFQGFVHESNIRYFVARELR